MSKIAAINTFPVSVALKRAYRTAHEASGEVRLLLVEVITSDGIKGYGQVSSTPMNDIAAWIGKLAPQVIGMNALAYTAVWEKLFALTSPQPGKGGLPRNARPQIMAAIGGIDMALWDIAGKAAGMPVYQMLGAQNKPVFTYGTGGYYVEGAKLTACADELAGFVANGYQAVKLKTGADTIANEVKRVAATRAAIGPDVSLMLDLNAAYDLPACIEFARAVAPFDIFWLEEPLHWHLQPADFALLGKATPIPLAHGERELTRFTTRDFMTLGNIRYVMFDATRAAGFTESLRVAHMADQLGVMITPHHAPELHCHLVAAFPRTGFAVESHGSHERDPIWHGLFSERAQVRDSHVYMNDKPGFGIEIDWAFAKRHAA
ncbi:MAG: mandelate racemase/muconate lactonizing enzyme family protein [Betaproteobacteria bacterium]|nr:mandelate racemase/muconate lactonizing enzyme family protein [Betaproteobacteria bacterium]